MVYQLVMNNGLNDECQVIGTFLFMSNRRTYIKIQKLPYPLDKYSISLNNVQMSQKTYFWYNIITTMEAKNNQ